MRLLTTNRFDRDIRLAARRGKDLGKLQAIVDRLLASQPLEPRNQAHRLSGQWSHCWECHIEPNWLLIWEQDRDALILVRLGTHADLFG